MSKLNPARIRINFAALIFLMLFLAAKTSFSQSAKINFIGTVLDSSGAPIQGVTVTSQQNKATVTTSDASGKFVIEVLAGSSLILSAIGYETHAYTTSEDAKVFTVKLKTMKLDLGEVVVVAFGKKQRKEAIVGSVTSITSKELKIPSSNLTTAFAGKLAGVIAYQRSGEPGADNANFFVRGVTTFGKGSGSPLILIDNIELTSTDLARLQPDDIESFSILKDASATSLYGARGANGVIFVTTKQGKEGKAKFNLRVENSISAPTKTIKLADPITYMKQYSEAQLTRDPLSQLIYQKNKIDHTIAGDNKYAYPATDWFALMFKDRTSTQRANMNLSGGTKVATYYVAGSYNLDHGILNVDPKNDFNSNVKLSSYQLRSNVNIKLTPATELAIKMFGIFDDYKGPIDGGTSMYQKALRSSPSRFAPYYPPDSANISAKHILFGNDKLGDNYFLNPYAEMVRGYKEYSQSRMLAQFELSQNLASITKGLNLKALFSTNRYSYFESIRSYGPFYHNVSLYNKKDDTYLLTWLNDPTSGNETRQLPEEYMAFEDLRNFGDQSRTKRDLNTNLYAQVSLDYSNTFNSKHTVGGTLVATIQQNLASTPPKKEGDNDGQIRDVQKSLPHRNSGVSGRASYSYDTRYFAEFNFGYNGSERFYKDRQFGFFPTIGLAWLVSNEDFFSNMSKALNKLKLRASYGLVGNDAIGDTKDDRFFFLSQVNLDDGNRGSSFGFNNGYRRNGISVQRYANAQITWEKSYQTNFAVEVGLYKKLNLVAEIYRQIRKSILQQRAFIPSTLGLDGGTPQANIGEAESKGIDLSLDFTENFRKDFWVSARASFTYARGTYKKYEEPGYETTPYRRHIGHSLSQSWGYIAERLFIDEKDVKNSPRQNFGLYGAGDIKYRDINKDGQITEADQVPIGNPTTPEITYGFGSSTGYKSFDFSIFFQGLARESFWIDTRATAPFINYDNKDTWSGFDNINGRFIGENALLQEYANSHWSEENRDLYAVWPRLSVTPINNNNQQSTWFMRDGSFLRVKSIELGYTLPIKLLRKYKINNMRFYLNGTNLFTFSKFKLWDPEMGGNGLAYPVQKVYNAGVNISF